MALINCPECSKEISDKATMYIHCGYPLVKEAGLTLGLYGVVAGSIGGSNVKMFCNGCGHKFNSSEAIKLTDSLRKYMKKSRK
jgi:hypothetical protein